MPCPLRPFNSYSLRWQHFIFDSLNHFSSHHYYTHLQLELFMVLVSGYVESVKLHHIWKPQLQAMVYHNIPHFSVLYHLYTTARCFDLYLRCNKYIYIKLKSRLSVCLHSLRVVQLTHKPLYISKWFLHHAKCSSSIFAKNINRRFYNCCCLPSATPRIQRGRQKLAGNIC